MKGFTAHQQRAIELRGNVLVLAGAGTGKTRTLIQRCLEWLQHRENSLDQILMVTFTEAAAAEMRHRIRSELKARYTSAPGDAHLAEQLALLDSAFISTLHSFCFRLIRQHFYQLELDPQLTVLPGEEAELLAQDTLTRIFQKHYSGSSDQSAAVQQLIQSQARGWDLPVKRLVLQLHRYAQALPEPSAWFSEQLRCFSCFEPQPWRQWFTQACREFARDWLPVVAALAPKAPNTAQCAAALRQMTPDASRDGVQTAFREILDADKAEWPRGTVGRVREPISDFFTEAEFLQTLAGRSPLDPALQETGNSPADGANSQTGATSDDPLLQDWEWVRTEMSTLLNLTVEFGREFALAKCELGVVDFADLEQFTLRLLWDSDRQQPTPLAEKWRQDLKLIFVDEYQDINAAQDAILRALACEPPNGNRFLVGDPKQSIYRFRLADPLIFQTYAREWQKAGSGTSVVALTDNFRSEQRILTFVNECFSALMHHEIGGIEYDELAHLQCGLKPRGSWTENGQTSDNDALSPLPQCVEFHVQVISAKADADSEHDPENANDLLASLSKAEKEARLVALRLAQLRAEKSCVRDKQTGQTRPVTWSDMVVLLRSPQHKVEAYAKEFSRLGIPLIAARGGFFESPAVRDLLGLLNVLDNPLQDIPLLAVLRSPIVGLSLDELALIRLASRGKFWTALGHFHRHFKAARPQANGGVTDVDPTPANSEREQKLTAALSQPKLRQIADSAWAKTDAFLVQMRAWRHLAQTASVSQCLDQVLTETHYDVLQFGHEQGQQHHANVTKLLGWARQFDQFQRQGLFRFIQFVEAQRQAAIDREPAPLATGDAVRLMSIHQSKGLEFGVVVLADLAKAFNRRDLQGEVILDRTYGLCPMVKPPFTQQRYPSLPYWLAQKARRKELLGEELRLLYVAMTRASDKLILTATSSASALERWGERANTAPSVRELVTAKSYVDWLGPWMSKATGDPAWVSAAQGHGRLAAWAVYQEDDARLREPAPPAPGDSSPAAARPEAALVHTVLERVSWQYPFEPATRQAAKASVSSLRAGFVSQLESEDRRSPARKSTPKASTSKLAAAEIGAAHHLLLQFAHPESLAHPGRLKVEADRLLADGLLSPTERAALDLESIAAFWQSQIGQEIIAHADCWHREMPFTIRLNLSEVNQIEQDYLRRWRNELGTAAGSAVWDPSAHDHEVLAEEFIVITGVVDVAVLLPNEIWILDFKTDAADPGHVQEKVALYEPQMKLYGLALSRIYQRPVGRAWLHFLSLRRTFLCR